MIVCRFDIVPWRSFCIFPLSVLTYTYPILPNRKFWIGFSDAKRYLHLKNDPHSFKSGYSTSKKEMYKYLVNVFFDIRCDQNFCTGVSLMYCIKPNNGSLACNNYNLHSFYFEKRTHFFAYCTNKRITISWCRCINLLFKNNSKYFHCNGEQKRA